jgi:hypothetical protein
MQKNIVRSLSREWLRKGSAAKSRLSSALTMCALLFCATPYLSGQTWSGFSAAASPTVSRPEGVAVGDFDGSGHTGFATCDTYGYVYVFLGNGNGTFTAAVPTMAPNCSILVAGDFNGDGKLDLAVPNFGNDTVLILLGNGNGTFTPGVSLALGTNNGPSSIAVGDFNGDGKLDIAVAVTVGSPSDLVKIFLGNGDGTFVAASTVTLGAYEPYGIAVGDFNGDGKLDLAVADSGSAEVTILLGNGDGTFAAGGQYATGSSPWGITTGDFNNDGKLDLAIANEGSNNVTILLGNGNGTFTAAASTATGKTPYGIAAADFNGDGNLDLAVVNSATSAQTVTILLGNGNGTFTAAAASPATGTYPMAIAVGDWNGDGFPDLVVPNYSSSNMTVLLNLGPFPTTTTLAASPNPVVYGNLLSLTATIANHGIGDPSPTGTVTFYSDGTSVGTGSVSSNVASATTTVLTAGTHTLTAQYAGSSSYNASTSSAITETILKATPGVTVSCSPNPTTFGSSTTTCTGQTSAGATGLMSLTCNGTAWGSGGVDSSGAFSISGLSGLLAGSYTIAATYAGDSNNIGGSGSTTYTINKATPKVTWATPAAITYGTALSATQLNATASTPGAFVYTPAAGTVLTVGVHTLSVTFTPTDTTDYTAASATVNLTVHKAVLTATANNASKVYGTANPAFTPSYSGFVNGDTSAVLTGSPSLTTTATAASPAGSYIITAAAGTLSTANYSFVFVNGTLTITKATSSLSISSTKNPSTYGQSVTFTLTVAGSGSGVTPTGTVTLTKGGTTLLGTTSLSASGTATYITSTLPVGVDTLQLNYSGDTNYF